MKAISILKLANSVKCGVGEETLLMAQNFDMTLDGVVIKIQSKKKKEDVIYTTLMNTIWWREDETKEPKAKGKA